MTAKQLLSDYSKYNLWANEMLTQWLLSKDHSLMDSELKSSFPTINKTLSHIWMAEHVWKSRIEGLPWSNLSGSHDGKDLIQICKDLMIASQYYVNKTEEISDLSLNSKIKYLYQSGEHGETELILILHHVFNHSTYHRGQLVTMGRELGFIDPPKTDFIHYKRKAIK